MDDTLGGGSVSVNDVPERCTGRLSQIRCFGWYYHITVHVQLKNVVANHVFLLNATGSYENPPGTILRRSTDSDAATAASAGGPALPVKGFAQLRNQGADGPGFLIGRFRNKSTTLRFGRYGTVFCGVTSDASPTIVNANPATLSRVQGNPTIARDGKHLRLYSTVGPTFSGLMQVMFSSGHCDVS